MEKVLFELTAGQLGSMPSATTTDPVGAGEVGEEEEEADDEMLKRLAGLRSA